MKNINKDYAHIEEVMRRAVVGAIAVIQQQAATFEAKRKAHYDGVSHDLVTTADNAAQEYYVNQFAEHLPGIGLLGEENGLNRPCELPGEDLYITIDPLDGTKAFARKQSTGVGTMIALVENGKVMAAFIGDVNTGEVYGFGPNQPQPVRVRFGIETPLEIDVNGKIRHRYILTDVNPLVCPPALKKLLLPAKDGHGGLFRDVDVGGGSYGLAIARLWKNEVAAVLLRPAHCTPWDEAPVMGITEALGFVYLKYDPATGVLEPFKHQVTKEVQKIDHYIIVTQAAFAPLIVEQMKLV